MRRPRINAAFSGLTTAFRARLTIGVLMTATAVGGIIVASLIAGYYAASVLIQNKVADTWAIMFLELEHEGTALAERIGAVATAKTPAPADDSILEADAGGLLSVIRGSFGTTVTLADFDLPGKTVPRDLAPLTVLTYNGEKYLATRQIVPTTGTAQLALRRIEPDAFVPRPGRPAADGALYLITKQGRLLYANDDAITEANVVQRPLVQHFIDAPITQGQMELTSAGGEEYYGFFTEVPRSNLVFFSEVARSAALAPIRLIVMRFLAVLAVIVVTAVLVLQYPLSRVTRPLRDLAQLAVRIGEGKFDRKPQHEAFGELATLSAAFSTMVASLAARELQVEHLTREQTKKVRLESEIAIAQRIQENLLPNKAPPRDSGLLLAAEYIPAAECAGDWYQHAYNAAEGEVIVVVADVSGHGTGSSVFTAVIAGLFETFRMQSTGPFDVKGFVTAANAVLFRLGRLEWHSTMLIARYRSRDSTIEIALAGHPFPFILGGSKAAARAPKLVSGDVLGLSPTYDAQTVQIPFAKGDSMLIYTDGLTEARDSQGRMFGRKRAADAFARGRGTPQDQMTRLLDSWRNHKGAVPADDDVCVVALRAS